MDEDTALFDLEIRVLLEAVFRRYQHDFRDYAVTSVRRRVEQAMQHFGCDSVAELQHKLLRDPQLFSHALGFFTVQLSELFRDPLYFLALRRHVVPVLQTYPSVKVWVAGCSTGEEVWSLAILLAEEGLLERSIVYATDINAESLRIAQSGVYEIDRLATFSRAYRESGAKRSLSDYYTAAYGSALFDKALAKNVVFSDHSLATDSVFAEVQLVSCRNVLIYFNTQLQERAIALFRESLVRKGFLGLGSRESLRAIQGGAGFTEVVREDRIFQKL